MLSVCYDSAAPALVFSDGTRAVIDEDVETGVLDEALLARVGIGELTAAIAAWATDHVPAQIWQLRPSPPPTRGPGLRERVLLVYDYEARELRTVVLLDVEMDDDPALEASLPALTGPVARRWSARTVIEPDPFKARWLTVQTVIDDDLRTASELLAVALDLEALLNAARDGVLTLQAAFDLVRGGHAGALVGAREGAWLDVKREPYRLGDDRQAWELGKDVAAFAGGQGGLILIPGSTRIERAAEVIDDVGVLPAELVDEQQYRDVIAARVFPPPRGVEVGFVEQKPGRGQFFVFVAPQDEEHKPFLVRGALLEGRVMAQSITLPWRDDDQTRYEEIAAVHGALRAGRQNERAERELLERVRLDSLPPEFAGIAQSARDAGLAVDVFHGGFRVHLPDGTPVDVNARDIHPKIEALALHSVLNQLRPYGVPSHTNARGFLVPEWAADPAGHSDTNRQPDG